MIDIPSLPTDNIYKFMALSGVFLFALALYFFSRFYASAVSRVSELEVMIAEQEAEISFIENQESPDKIQMLKVSMKHNKIKALVGGVALQRKQLTQAFVVSVVIALVGTLVAYLGFNLWYYRTQIYQDKLIELRVKELKELHSTTLIELKHFKLTLI